MLYNVVVDSNVVACGLDDKQLAFAVARQWSDCFPLSVVKVIEIQSYRGFFNA